MKSSRFFFTDDFSVIILFFDKSFRDTFDEIKEPMNFKEIYLGKT